MVRHRRVVVVMLCAALTWGCDEPDFGDKALKFVNDELGPLSLQLARADLAVRWPRAFQLLIVDVSGRLENADSALRNIEHATRDIKGGSPLDQLRAARDYES